MKYLECGNKCKKGKLVLANFDARISDIAIRPKNTRTSGTGIVSTLFFLKRCDSVELIGNKMLTKNELIFSRIQHIISIDRGSIFGRVPAI